jgi:DNA-binding CsgD family transcriptional regulator
MSNDLLPITQRLDKLINLVAIGLTSDKSQREQLVLLSKAGFQPKEIADMLGTTPNTIRVELSTLRSAKKRKK